MIEEGVLENPKVDAAIAIHIWSLIPSGRVSITPGVVMGGLDVFKLRTNRQIYPTTIPSLTLMKMY